MDLLGLVPGSEMKTQAHVETQKYVERHVYTYVKIHPTKNFTRHCDMKDLLSSKPDFPILFLEGLILKLKTQATNYACAICAICAICAYADLNLKLSAVDRPNCKGERGWQFGSVIFLRKSYICPTYTSPRAQHIL